MQWHELIFSRHPVQRFQRHSLFWVLWLMYFASTFFFTQQGHNQNGIAPWILTIACKSILLLMAHAFVTYTFIYFILPRYILQRRYFAAAAIFILSGTVCVAWSYCCYVVFFPLIDAVFQNEAGLAKNLLIWSSITAGIISALKVLAAATAIKLLKQWYFKQKENEQLQKEKISTEMRLLKAQIHPPVLFTTLDNIYAYALSDTPKASALLLRLSDLLSFMLYECDELYIPLEKEIKMLKDYVSLEKLRMGNQLEMGLSVKGDIKNIVIAPLLLLPFLEQSLSYCYDDILENNWIDLDIRIEGAELSMKLISGKAVEGNNVTCYRESNLSAVSKRLALLYPERHSIREQATPEMKMILVKIQLQQTVENIRETNILISTH